VLCVPHGFTWGLALDLCCGCDIRICSADAHFSVKEVDLAVIADLGTLQLLPKIVANLGWVKEVCFSARGFGADEALQVGFVSKVEKTKADAFAQALDMAQTIASKSPVAVQGTKAILDYSSDHSLQDGTQNSILPIHCERILTD